MSITNRTSINLSGTLGASNTFQSIDAQSPERQGFAFQNHSATNNMWLFFGPIASATEDASIIVAPLQVLNVNAPGVTLGDQISVAGTSGDKFYAARQG